MKREDNLGLHLDRVKYIFVCFGNAVPIFQHSKLAVMMAMMLIMQKILRVYEPGLLFAKGYFQTARP